MYSSKVTEIQVAQLESLTGLKLQRLPVQTYQHYKAVLGKEPRHTSNEEKSFIRNEVLLSMLDYRYWANRYCYIEYDGCEGGGVGTMKFWEAQEILLSKIARAEEEAFDNFMHKEPTDGIRLVDHKARQLGGTALARSMMMHLASLHANKRLMAASVDEDKLLELYDRDKIILDHLPWWMHPGLDSGKGDFDVKGEHIKFDSIGSRILYQHSKQQSGAGQGRHFDGGHLTECSSWAAPNFDIEMAFFPTLGQWWSTLVILESQAMGRGNWWHDFSERARRGRIPGWIYAFVPWYAEPKKYRRKPPPNWKPSEITMKHAEKVYNTSEEFLGRKVLLPREQLYWYQETRKQYAGSDQLNYFLTCYAATPEESFQHTTKSAFSTAALERMDLCVSQGLAFSLEAVD